jgi:hypothetical protein
MTLKGTSEKKHWEMTRKEFEEHFPIRSSAFKLPNGQVVEGHTHPQIANHLEMLGKWPGWGEVEKTVIPGFVTREGKFITRDEAAKLVGSAHNLLHSRDLGAFGPEKHDILIHDALKRGIPVKEEILKEYPWLHRIAQKYFSHLIIKSD